MVWVILIRLKQFLANLITYTSTNSIRNSMPVMSSSSCDDQILSLIWLQVVPVEDDINDIQSTWTSRRAALSNIDLGFNVRTAQGF